MRDDILTPVTDETTLQKIYVYFLRLLSLFCLALTVGYWIRIIGVFPGNLWRIDLMPRQWQVLTAVLSVVYPIAACGLWMRSGWGIVLWFGAGLAESLAMTVYSADYIWFPAIAVMHGIFLIAFIGFQILLFFEKRRIKRMPMAY